MFRPRRSARKQGNCAEWIDRGDHFAPVLLCNTSMTEAPHSPSSGCDEYSATRGVPRIEAHAMISSLAIEAPRRKPVRSLGDCLGISVTPRCQGGTSRSRDIDREGLALYSGTLRGPRSSVRSGCLGCSRRFRDHNGGLTEAIERLRAVRTVPAANRPRWVEAVIGALRVWTSR